MLNKRKHIAIHVLDPKSDNETYDKVGGRMLKIGKEKRKFESDPDLYALDKMSQSATNATREKKRSKKVEEAYKEPNLDKMEKRAAHYEKRSDERREKNLERLKRDFPGMTHGSGADNQVAKDFHRARKIKNAIRDISNAGLDLHALDKMSISASNYMRGKEPKKPKPKPEHVTINLESYIE